MRDGLGLVVIGVIIGLAAGGEPDYGLDFVTIGDPGNRDTTLEETSRYGLPGGHVGRVDYEFRLMRTEVTIEQYLEFVVAYYPIYVQNTGNEIARPAFRGHGIHASFGEIHILPGYSPDQAAAMGWEYAARFVNWLHNGKIIEEWAFESGVYETSTFYEDADGVAQHQETHHPNARYWLPTKDEWIKAGYWDPEKDAGEGGYWQFQNRSDVEPIPALLPTQGGERNAGPLGSIWPLNVGSFPNSVSHWRVVDMAGGEKEHTETVPSTGDRGCRFHMGSSWLSYEYGDIFSSDLLASAEIHPVWSSGVGLRVASRSRHAADVNGDWSVDYFDVSAFIRLFVSDDIRADFNQDGVVDVQDAYWFLDAIE